MRKMPLLVIPVICNIKQNEEETLINSAIVKKTTMSNKNIMICENL